MGYLTKISMIQKKKYIIEADSYSSGRKRPCIYGVRGIITKLTTECR
jgi:hypothetical protein